MKKAAVIFAMDKEMEKFSGTINKLPDVECRMAVSGIGKVNAALCADRMIRKLSPDFVLLAGVAGGLVSGIRQNEIVIASRVAYHDVWCGEGNAVGQIQGLPAVFESDPGLVSKALTLFPDARAGLVISGDQYYVEKSEDRRQRRLFPDALAVDMESAAVAQACYLARVPFLCVKVISDVHEGCQAEMYADFWNSSDDVMSG